MPVLRRTGFVFRVGQCVRLQYVVNQETGVDRAARRRRQSQSDHHVQLPVEGA
jgi:hypothetical protein